MNLLRSPRIALTALTILAASASPAAAATITAKISAPPLLRKSPFTITFSAPVMNVNTTGKLGTDLTVSVVKNPSKVYPGQAACFDAKSGQVDCGTGPVSTVKFTTNTPLVAGQYYQVNLGAKIQGYDGTPFSATEAVVRAQTFFNPNQWGETYTWMTDGDSPPFLGGSYIGEDAPNATLTYNFSGTSFGLYTSEFVEYGKAKVAITQVGGPTITQTIDTYSPTDIDDFLWSWSLLPGNHRFTLTTTGTHNPASLGSWIYVDAVVVDGVVDDTPAFTATWGHPATWMGHPAGWSGTGGSSACPCEAAPSMTLNFYGRSATVAYATGPSMGQGTVSVDGSTVATVIETAASSGSSTYTTPTLPVGIHQLILYGGGAGIFNYQTITIH